MQTGKPQSRRSFLRTTAAASLGLTLAGLAAPAAAQTQVPFSASFSGVVTGTTHLPGGIIQNDASVSGNATYLGNFTGARTILIDQGNWTGTASWVGANGTDRVFIAISGPTGSPPHGSCMATSTGTYTVTGGTGAFANATGSGTFTSQFDECAGSATTTLTGTISQPN